MKSDQDPVRIFRLLESSHGEEPRIEVADVGFETIGGCGDRRIFEVREGVACGFEKPMECLKLDGIDLEEILPGESLNVPLAEEKRCRRGIEEELAVPVDEEFLGVFGMPSLVLQLELQPHAQVAEKMHMAAFDLGAVCLKHLP